MGLRGEPVKREREGVAENGAEAAANAVQNAIHCSHSKLPDSVHCYIFPSHLSLFIASSGQFAQSKSCK